MEPVNPSQRCGHCGVPLGSDALAGLCPQCMLLSALGPEPETPPGSEEEPLTPTPLPASPALSRFGDYELLEELAHGGMGVIYRARQVRLDRIVAIKMLLLGQRASDEVVERFKREAQSAARLRHPHIVTIHEVGDVEGQPFFSMDYIQGKDLARIVRESPLPARRAAAYVRAVAEAIHYAHQQGIIHRDLKPSNILIDFATDEVRVTDFGLAKRLDDDSDLTLTGQVLGSPNHMAPELAAGHHRLASSASDVFSLGAILYDLLTGRPPFLADSIQATLLKIRDTEPVAPRELHAGIPRDLETICLKCLEKEPAARFASAQELADELGRFLRGEPIRTRPINALERTWRWCRRKPVLAGLAAAIVVLAVVSTVTAIGMGVARQRQQREQYYAEISLAKHHIEEGNIDLALEKLMRCPPAQRHWEWGRLLYLCHQDILTIQAHTNVLSTMDIRSGEKTHLFSIEWIGFSPDTNQVVTLGTDGAAKAWRVTDGRPAFAFGGRSNQVSVLAFSPDGSQLAAAEGLQVHLRDPHIGRITLTLPNLVSRARCLAWHPQADRLAVGFADGSVLIYDAGHGAQAGSIPKGDGPLGRLFYTPDGKCLVREQQRRCTTFDNLSGQELADFRLRPEQGYWLTSDPEMGRLVSIDLDDWMTLWENGQPRSIPGRSQRIGGLGLAAQFSPDGRRFATRAGFDHAKIWDAATRRPVCWIPETVTDAVFSPNGRLLATLGQKSVVSVWDAETGRAVRVLRGHRNLVTHVAFSPDSRLVATAALDGVVKLWSATDGREAILGSSIAWGSTVSRDGTLFTTGPLTEGITIHESRSGRALMRLKVENDQLNMADFSPDGTRLISSSRLHQPRVWDVQTGESLFTLEGHTRGVISGAAFSPDGRQIVTSDIGGTTRVWDAANGRALHVLAGRSFWAGRDVFSPDGRLIATMAGQPPAEVTLWDTDTGQPIRRIRAHESGCSLVIFSPDNSCVVSSGHDDSIRFWDTRSGALKKELRLRASVVLMVFSPDGRRLFCSTMKTAAAWRDIPTFEVWDVHAGRQVANLPGHSGDLDQLAISTDGKKIVTGGSDDVTRQWEIFPWTDSEYPGSARTDFLVRAREYAKLYWRDRLAAEGVAWNHSEPLRVNVVPFDRSILPPRDPRVPARLIDLTRHYNSPLDRPAVPCWTEAVDNDLRNLAPGVADYVGVPFDARGVIQLRQKHRWRGIFRMLWNEWPARIGGIPIGLRVRRLHILHGTADRESDGTAIGALVWHYADGQRHESEIVYGRHVRDWWSRNDLGATSEARIAWQGTNPSATNAQRENPVGESGKELRLYVAAWDNPRPDVEVVSLDFVSRDQQSAPFVVAITVE